MEITTHSVKSSFRWAGVMVGAALLAACTSGSFAQSVGVNFVSDGDHINDSDADSLATTDSAGAPGYAQVNWNNLGRYGNGDPGVTLYDSTGTATSLNIDWDAATITSSGSALPRTPDGKLMDGLLSTDWGGGPADTNLTANSVYAAGFSNKPLVFVGGLQSWLAAQGATSYTIVLYVAGWHGWYGTSEHWIQAVTGNSAWYNMVPGADLTSHLFNADTGPFNGTYSLIGSDATSIASRGYGNYEVFTNLTDDAILLRISEPTDDYAAASLHAFQIVPVFAGGAPVVSAITVSPSGATTSGVYSGQNVRLSAGATGLAPMNFQWQAGPDGSTWTNVPGATSSTLLVNPLIVGTVHYSLVVTNSAGAGTSAAAAVVFNPLPSTPAGLWTANFQVTNNLDASHNVGSGIGRYVGRGILGNGTYWNVLPQILTSENTYIASDLSSVSDLLDDGAVHSGIYCDIKVVGGNASVSSLPYSSNIGNLLDQYSENYYGPGALQFHGVPDGTYNLVIYSINGTYATNGTTFVVNDSINGNQTASTVNGSVVPSAGALALGDNFVVFSNVHISGGSLKVDLSANAPSTEADINGAQLQLVNYDSPAPSVTLSNTVAGSSMSLNWSQGILQTATNLLGPWTPIYAPSPVTVSTTNAAQFYRVKI